MIDLIPFSLHTSIRPTNQAIGYAFITVELRLMYRLLNRLGHEGLEPLLQHLENFIKQSGLDDMKACVEIIVTVSH